MSGWIKLHRGLIDWEWYTDHNTCRLFIHCILRANFEDKVWRGIPINRGSFYTSLDTLASETGLTHRQIRTALDKLALTGDVSGSGMARGRMITVVHYELYQQDDRLDVDEKAGKGQALDRVATTNKNLITKEVKNTNKYSCEDYSLSTEIYKLIRNIAPHTKEPNFESWANTIRLMRETDKIPLDTIQQVFVWANKDGFWATNILSASKLRKQFNQLQAKMVQSNGQQNQSGQTSGGYKLSAVERVRAVNAENRAARESDRDSMGDIDGHLRVESGQPVRDSDAGCMADALEGSYTKAD